MNYQVITKTVMRDGTIREEMHFSSMSEKEMELRISYLKDYFSLIGSCKQIDKYTIAFNDFYLKRELTVSQTDKDNIKNDTSWFDYLKLAFTIHSENKFKRYLINLKYRMKCKRMHMKDITTGII